jgi:hypothetical protein
VVKQETWRRPAVPGRVGSPSPERGSTLALHRDAAWCPSHCEVLTRTSLAAELWVKCGVASSIGRGSGVMERPVRMLVRCPSLPTITPGIPHTTSQHVSILNLSPASLFIKHTTAGKMSAIADSTDGPIEVIKVLFVLYPGYNTLDVAGPLEILSRSLHNSKDKGTPPTSTSFSSHRLRRRSFVDT